VIKALAGATGGGLLGGVRFGGDPAAAQEATATSAASATPTTKPLAPKAVADQAVETVTLFVKRAGSTNPAVRHRAWEMFTPDAQTTVFFGTEDAFYVGAGEILQIGDVTVEEVGIGVPVALGGFWGPHAFSNNLFLLTDDATKIEDITLLDEENVPDGVTSTKVTVNVTDATISTRTKPLATKDVVLITFVNKGSATHGVAVYRLDDGQTADDLLAQIHTGGATDRLYALALLDTGERQSEGVMGMDPGTYLITGMPTRGQGPETESLVDVTTTLTVS
jgi:hypothetical protein